MVLPVKKFKLCIAAFFSAALVSCGYPNKLAQLRHPGLVVRLIDFTHSRSRPADGVSIALLLVTVKQCHNAPSDCYPGELAQPSLTGSVDSIPIFTGSNCAIAWGCNSYWDSLTVKELPPHGESSIIRVQDASATFEIEIAHLWDHRDVEITSHPDKTIFDGDLVTYRYLPDTDILPERACLFFGDSALCELRPVLTDGNSFQLVMNSNTRGAVDTRMTFGEEVPLEVISCKGAESCAATLDSFEFRDQITLVGR